MDEERGRRLCRCARFIVKPAEGTQGSGIFILRRWNELGAALPLLRGGAVIQQYVGDPLLVDGFKFDLRVYVLVTSVDPLRAHVCREGLVRFCTEKYDNTDKSNVYAHLTNYSLNKKSSKFTYTDETGNTGTKRMISAFFRKLASEGVDIDALWQGIDDIACKTLLTMQPLLAENYRHRMGTQNLGRSCFQIVGFDILLDSSYNPWLLEVNNNPDWSVIQEGELSHVDAVVKGAVVQGGLQIVMAERAAELTELSAARLKSKSKKNLKKPSLTEWAVDHVSWSADPDDATHDTGFQFQYQRVFPPVTPADPSVERSPLRHQRTGDLSRLQILDDVRRLHRAIFMDRGSQQDRAWLRRFVNKCGLMNDGMLNSSQLDLHFSIAERDNAPMNWPPMHGRSVHLFVFCDFLINVGRFLSPKVESDYEALATILCKKTMLPTQARKLARRFAKPRH